MKKARPVKNPTRKTSTKATSSSPKSANKEKRTAISTVPNPEPRFSPSLSDFLKKWTILPPDFFQIDALDLAPRLLGKFLRRDDVVLQITEVITAVALLLLALTVYLNVEAYRPDDSASHGRFGVTGRTAPVFGRGGHAYVYLCYGIHFMLNVVADKEGIGAGVLIRSCAPVHGLETIQQRRGLQTEKPLLLTGPGKFIFPLILFVALAWKVI
ncbi:unnamed protein product [Cuscuta campestris]|uniref:DNA-3-methyladenine glycosylase II n=1 Tax=Cuscuta campestris TaxID=132261 RepID=A0A484L7P0_9ASTE|nr:unnamed protein product [Cuscuta campestris]